MTLSAGGRWSIWIAALVPFAGFFQGLASFALGPAWKDRLLLDDTALSSVWLCYVGGVLIALLIAPPIARERAVRVVLIVALSVSLAGCVLLAASESLPVTAVGRFCAGIGTGAAASVGVAGVLSLGRRHRGLAVAVTSGATLAGSALGALLSSAAVQWMSRPDIVVFATAGTVVALAIAAAAVSPYGVERVAGSSPPAPAARSGSIAPAILLQVCVAAPAGVMLALGPVILGSVSRESPGGLGLLSIALFGGGLVGQLVGQGMPVAPRRWVSLGLTVTSCAVAVAAVVLQWPLLIVAAGAATGIGSAVGQLGVFAELQNLRAGAALAVATSTGFLASYAANGALPLVIGAVSDATGDYALALGVLLAVVTALAGCAAVSAVRHSRAARSTRWSEATGRSRVSG